MIACRSAGEAHQQSAECERHSYSGTPAGAAGGQEQLFWEGSGLKTCGDERFF